CKLDDLSDEFRARLDDLGGDGGADVAASESERAAFAFAAASNPAFGRQGMGRLCGENLRGALLRGLEDLWIAADRIFADLIPEGRVRIRNQAMFGTMRRERVDQAKLDLHLVYVCEPRPIEAGAGVNRFAFEHDRAVATERRNAEPGQGVVLTCGEERVRGGG